MSNIASSEDASFVSLAIAVSPQWRETILRLTQATDRLASRFDQFIGADKQVDTVKACRELAAELINFLDGLEDTDQDAAVDDEPCDTDELEIGEGDDEPSLGSSGHADAGPIIYLSHPISDGSEMIYDCEGDEHDGAEPDEADYEPSIGFDESEIDNSDDEPSLGSLSDGFGTADQQFTWSQRDSSNGFNHFSDREADPGENGIGDSDGLREQEGRLDWQPGAFG